MKPRRSFDRRYVRRRRQTPEQQAADRRLIEKHVAERGVTKCPDGIAAGAVPTAAEDLAEVLTPASTPRRITE